MSALVFFPWLRQGIGMAIEGQSFDRSHAVLKVKPLVNKYEEGQDAKASPDGKPLTADTVDLNLRGPGDVMSIDPRVVIRTYPDAGSREVDVSSLAVIEFSRPDLPWLFTPMGEGGQRRLVPWIALVVVERKPETLTVTEKGLPQLKVPVTELPAPSSPTSDAWAWAHAQVLLDDSQASVGAQGQVTLNPTLTLEAVAKLAWEKPERALSRLICPRALTPDTDYLAALVPVFEVGRLAGLGLEVPSEMGLEPAWGREKSGPDARVTLPIYHHWEFHSGPHAGVAELGARLRPVDLKARANGDLRQSVGVRQVTVSLPGSGTPFVQPFSGVLQQLGLTSTKPGEVTRFAAELAPVLAQKDAVVPPSYGSDYAANTETAGWRSELNLDPAFRSAAGAGRRVVQERQEALVEEAWAQADQLPRVLEILRRQQLAAAISDALHVRKFSPAMTQARSGMTAPVKSATQSVAYQKLARKRVIPAYKNIHAWEEADAGELDVQVPVPEAVPARTGRAYLDEGSNADPWRVTLEHLISPKLQADGSQYDPLVKTKGNGWRGSRFPIAPLVGDVMSSVTLVYHRELRTAKGGFSYDFPREDVLWHVDEGRTDDLALEAAQRAAFVAQRSYLERFQKMTSQKAAKPATQSASPGQPGASESQAPARPSIQRTRELLEKLLVPPNPQPAGGANGSAPPPLPDDRMNEMTGTSSARALGLLNPFVIVPRISHGMVEELVELAPDQLLPGRESVPPNSVSLLQVDNGMLEAYLVGLNHELSRELRWRGYTLPPAATLFDHFWPPSEPGASGIPDIEGWTGRLGTNTSSEAQRVNSVMLLRSDLVRWFPDILCYAVPAGADGGPPPLPTRQTPAPTPVYPIYRGRLGADMLVCAFPPLQNTGGYYFVLEEQPTAPRFSTQEKTSSNGYLSVDRLAIQAGEENGVKVLNAGHVASSLLMAPFRLLVKKSLLEVNHG